MKLTHSGWAALLTALAACGGEAPPATNALPALAASPDITVSGISSGGYMAGQFQVARSASVAGAAIVAAGPWGCALGEIGRALGPCMSGEGLDVEPLRVKASDLAAAGRIDPLESLAEHSVLVFRGTHDAAIGPPVTQAAATFLANEQAVAEITEVSDVPAAHGWVTESHGGDCDSFVSPYIVDCGYDLAAEVLKRFYGDLAPAAPASQPLEFSQSEFGDAELADTGYVYIPAACRGESCRIHVFFHGCEQSAETIGAELVTHSGFNRWAESNRVIVLYPQVAPSSMAPMNPLGCWDWWGYTGEDYLAKDAPQIAAVQAMIERLASD